MLAGCFVLTFVLSIYINLYVYALNRCIKMNKRKGSLLDDSDVDVKKYKETENVKKHSLDSDEEDDNHDVYNIMNENDIEGEEDGVAGNEDGIRITAFNMRDEMEEGHFDSDGHFIWNKDTDIRDNWLDNIDWHQIKPKEKTSITLGDDSDSEEDEASKNFNEIETYKEILKYMEPKENVTKALRRLGGAGKKLSSVERLKLKKSGRLVEQSEKVVKFTELVNNFLNQTGNMDIYQETFEKITHMIAASERKLKVKPTAKELDMYADDFEKQEKERLDEPGSSSTKENTTEDTDNTNGSNELMWEFKWTKDAKEVEGPNTTEQMQKFVDEGKFKDGVWVRRCGQDQFYASNRIDFELYLS